MPPSDPIDIIATQILVEAKQALKELDNFKTKVELVRKMTDKVAKQIGGDWNVAALAVKKFATAMGMTGKEVEIALRVIAKETDAYTNKLERLNAEQKKVAASGDVLSRKLLAQQKAFDTIPAKPITPQLAVPAFVKANFGDINSYIAQSQNKIEAWKRVVVASARQAGISFEMAGAQLKKMVSGTSVAPLNTALKQLGDDGRSSFQKIIDSANIMRIALGAVISMLLFQGIQAVTQFAKESVKQFTELEESLFRIGAAEKVLSEAGSEVSVSGLKKGITELREELKIFSEEELTKLVGQLAILTKGLGLSETQILAFAKAVAIKNKVSIDDESLDQTGSKLVTTVLTDNSKGAANLGIDLREAAIQSKALKMGLLEAGEAASELTAKEKEMVKFQIIIDSAAGDAERWADFLDTNSAKLSENTAAWEEFQVAAGGFFATLTPAVTGMLEGLTGAVNMFKSLVILFDVGRVAVANFFGAISTGANALDAIRKGILSFQDIPKIFDKIASEAVPKLFAKIPNDAPDWFKNLFGKFFTDVETATAEVEDLTSIDNDETEDTLAKLDDQLRDIAIDAQHAKEDLEVLLSQKQEDIEVKFNQKTQDIDTEYIRKEEDAAVDLQRKISDIERDAARDRQNVLDKAREEEKKAEEDHQLKLWELKMRYLMDLEDALHARDARQIIRLQRQYELDKELLEKKKEQEDQERQDSLEADLEDVEAKRQERLQDAQIEYQQKLADLAVAKQRELEELNTWKAREQADLQVWYQRELEEIDRQTQQKIERLLAGYIEEGKLHEEQQEAIHQILLKYFGENKKLVDDLVAYTNNAFGGMASMIQGVFVQAGSLLAGLGAEVGSVAINPFAGSQTIPTYDQMLQNQISGGGQRYGEGGTVIATKPTRAVFGERGPEVAQFAPLNRNGRDVNKLFGDVGGGGGEGRISLDILLSPDLEARIVEHSMDGVAEVVTRVNRSKI